MLVQGAVHGGAYLEERMEAFIHQYNSFLADELTSAELELNKQSLLSEYTQKPLSLSEQNTRYVSIDLSV